MKNYELLSDMEKSEIRKVNMTDINEVTSLEARLLATLELVDESGGVIEIKGYTDSAGVKKDIACRVLPPGGYKDLVEKSLHELFAMEDADPAAKAKLVKSFQNTLERYDQGGSSAGGVHAVFRPGDPQGLGRHHIEEGVFYLTGLLDVSGNELEVKGASEAVRTANALKNKLPVGRYVAMLRIEDGKYDTINWREND